ncbi:uncharacterized protein [Nicotiana sylvestris]|uniref:uncharacterized protein n=1 Tax=Nicotiana sylvestris TaxID=4096 RepID=UPI00388C9E5D
MTILTNIQGKERETVLVMMEKAVSSKADNQNTLKSSGWIKSTYTRRCIFHYAKEDEKLVKKFIVWLGKEKRRGRKKEGQIDLYADDNSLRKKPYKLYHQKISSKIFFLELSDSKFVLDDKHIDIALYYLRKKECYHPRDHPFRCTTTDVLFDNYMALAYKDFSEDASDEFWCAGDNQLFLTPYVWGTAVDVELHGLRLTKSFFHVGFLQKMMKL